jgi:hypothetical protein
MPETSRAVYESTVLVSECPGRKYRWREWLLVAAFGIAAVAVTQVLEQSHAWLLVLAWAVLVVAVHYAQQLGRVVVSSDMIRVQRGGVATECARSRIVIVNASSGGVQVSTDDGQWFLFSWPLFLPSRRRRDRLLEALSPESQGDMPEVTRFSSLASLRAAFDREREHRPD